MRRSAAWAVPIAILALLAGCSEHREATPPVASAPTLAPAVATTSTSVAERVAVGRVGEPFDLAEIHVTVLSVEDPFPSTQPVESASGNRLVMVKYEMVSRRADIVNLSDLPSIELRDASGTIFRSEHSRLSLVAGASAPAALGPGKRMESSSVFEVAASASGLRAAFLAGSEPTADVVLVPLQ